MSLSSCICHCSFYDCRGKSYGDQKGESSQGHQFDGEIAIVKIRQRVGENGEQEK